MRKLAIIFCWWAAACTAQTPTFSLYLGLNTSTPIPNNAIVDLGTTPGNVTLQTIKIVNNAANTVSLNLLRTILSGTPNLNVSGTPNPPETYFCFGSTCYPNNVNSPTGGDYTVLRPAGTSATVFPYSYDSDLNNQQFKPFLEEGPSVGFYSVRYKVFNLVNANDSIAFVLRYNFITGLKEKASGISGWELYPNPASENLYLYSVTNKAGVAHLSFYNALGALIRTKDIALEQGRKSMDVDVTGMAEGLYMVRINSGDEEICRRILIRH